MKNRRIAKPAFFNLAARIWLTLICLTSISASANIITVTNTSDSGPGSLRQALAIANDGDTITFAVTGTIGLTTGELMVNNSITISGPGSQTLTVNANAMSRVFHISSGTTVTISGLTITNGNALPSDDYGGGIYNDHAMLMLSNSAVTLNTAQIGGGGIYNDGTNSGSATLQISNSLIASNATLFGGGIFNAGVNGGSAALAISDSTLSDNTTEGYEGGGILNYGFGGVAAAQITNSTFNDNLSGYGGGVENYALSGGNATVGVDNSTFSSNSASFGAAIENAGTTTISDSKVNDQTKRASSGRPGTLATLTITNSTFSNNSAPGSADSVDNSLAMTSIGNTVMNAGAGGTNITNENGIVISRGYNLSSDDGSGYLTGAGDQINTDPLLGPLQDNGGPTFTCALLPGSPAVDMGDPNFTPPPFYDQRGPGYPRVVNGRIDKGSFEVQAGSTPTPTATATFTATPTATFTPTPTATASHTPTATPTFTATATPTVTFTPTPTASPTPTATPTASGTPTATSTPTPTPTPCTGRCSPTPRPRPTRPPRP
jgi:hypothetical protein